MIDQKLKYHYSLIVKLLKVVLTSCLLTVFMAQSVSSVINLNIDSTSELLESELETGEEKRRRL